MHTPLSLLPILGIVTLLLLQEGEEAVDRVPGQVVAVVTAMVVMLLTMMQVLVLLAGYARGRCARLQREWEAACGGLAECAAAAEVGV